MRKRKRCKTLGRVAEIRLDKFLDSAKEAGLIKRILAVTSTQERDAASRLRGAGDGGTASGAGLCRTILRPFIAPDSMDPP